MSNSRQATGKKRVPKKPSNSKNNSSNVRSSRNAPGPIGNQTMAFVASSRRQMSARPQVSSNAKTCVVRHRELIGSVSGSDVFTQQAALQINPGLPVSFPWLSGIARNWEKYRFKKLKYCYYPRTGTTTNGSLLLATDYDAGDVAPLNEQIAASYDGAVEDAPWKEIPCNLGSDKLAEKGQFKFVRTDSLAPNLDIKTYDGGVFYVYSNDGAVVPWGKLWVEYECEFHTPQLRPDGPFTVSGGTILGASGMTAADPLGTAPVITDLSENIAVDGLSHVRFASVGTYLFCVRIAGTTVTDIPVSSTTATVTALTGAVPNAAGTLALRNFLVVVDIPNSIVNVTATAATVTASSVWIATAPNGSLTS